MQQESELLVKAIEGLTGDSFKNYIYPISIAFFSSLLGFVTAYFTIRYKENIQIKRRKLDVINEWTLMLEGALSNLLAIKSNYHGKLSKNPLQRLAVIRCIIFEAFPLKANLHDLSFVVPNKNEKNFVKWLQITLIGGMVANYNFLIKLWEIRNNKNQSLKDLLCSKYGNKPFLKINQNETIAAVGQKDLAVLIDLNEQSINLTDVLITDLNDFLIEFPNYLKKRFKNIKRYGSLLTYSNDDNKRRLELLSKSPEADYTTIEELFGETADQIKQRYNINTGF